MILKGTREREYKRRERKKIERSKGDERAGRAGDLRMAG